MSAETPAVAAAVPPPLGWCSWCLGEQDVERPAVTLFAGTALCRDCNRRANEEEDEQQDDMAALAAQAGAQLRGILQPPPGSGPGQAGF